MLKEGTFRYSLHNRIVKNKHKGLGDTIEAILSFTGVKDVVEKVTDGDCGCEERKEKLNELFPYKK